MSHYDRYGVDAFSTRNERRAFRKKGVKHRRFHFAHGGAGCMCTNCVKRNQPHNFARWRRMGFV